MKPHKHAELIKAWADGAEIEFWNGFAWQDAGVPRWDDEGLYRIKPELKPDVVLYALVHRVAHHLPCSPYASISSAYGQFPDPQNPANLKLIFDGETGEPKSAEVIK